jgi:hypothetical protein
MTDAPENTSVTSLLKGRLLDPFFGPYTSFFITWNFPILLYFIKDPDGETARIHIHTWILSRTYFLTYFWPFLSTVTYLFLWPHLRRWIAVQQTKDNEKETNAKRDAVNNSDSEIVIANLKDEIRGLTGNVRQLQSGVDHARSAKQTLDQVTAGLNGNGQFLRREYHIAHASLSSIDSLIKPKPPLDEKGRYKGIVDS